MASDLESFAYFEVVSEFFSLAYYSLVHNFHYLVVVGSSHSVKRYRSGAIAVFLWLCRGPACHPYVLAVWPRCRWIYRRKGHLYL